MPKQCKILICLLSFAFCIKSQVNLVVNPSFEVDSACPTGLSGQVNKAIGWDTCHGSADYFNICGTITAVQVPKNLFGNQQPASGNAYGGFISYDNGGLYREIIIGQLTTSLIISQKYYISFNINRGDSNYFAGYSTNKLGAKLSTTKQSNVAIDNAAHYYTNNVITDTLNWTRLFGSIIADSAYQYIMFGNFFDDSNTTKILDANGPIAYYYIDDVCLSTDSAFAQNYSTGIDATLKEDDTKIFPNPADKYITVTSGLNSTFKIFNGINMVILFEGEIKNNDLSINCSNWESGLYFVQLKNKFYKLIINHQK